MSAPSARTRTFVAWTLRHATVLWTLALLLAVPASIRTARMYWNLRSDLEQLLPQDAPSVKAVEELRARMPGLQHLGVIVDVGKPENLAAGERLLDDLATRLRAYPKELVRAVRVGDAEERAFVEAHAPLYLDLDDLDIIRTRIEDRRDYEISKKTGMLLDDDGPPPLAFDDLQKKYEGRSGARRTAHGRFSSAEKHVTLLLVEVPTTGGRGKELLERVRRDLAELGIDRYAPGMRVGFTGDVAISVEETSALMTDLGVSSVLVSLAVVAVIVLFFRWWQSVVVLLVPLLLATVYSFALASLPPFRVTALNSNTAFLGSIVVGNGINFGIMLLARHTEERRRGANVDEALSLGLAFARPGTFAAAMAASISYGSLIITDFRGFRQFGFIGAIGMVTSWITAFVLMPSLIRVLDTKAHAPRSERSLMARLGASVAGRPLVYLTAAAVLLGGSGLALRKLDAGHLETDLSKLRRRDTWVSGEGYWGRRMDDLLGAYLTPLVILTDNPAQSRRVVQALRDAATRPPLSDIVASIRTIDDVVPTEQDAKIEKTEAIRKLLTPTILANLSEQHRAALDRFLGKGPLTPITVSDVPATFTLGLRERDGTVGHAVVVFPRPSGALWKGDKLVELVATLRATVEKDASVAARPPRIAGSLAVSADILSSMRRDGMRSSLAALGGVVLVVLFLFGTRRLGLLVVATLLTGVLWLMAMSVALGIKINFANFIAFPITFGIGVDYAVNVATRWREDHDASAAVRATGGAVALCSVTTVLGYSSLLLAENQALFLFGVLAVLGELACLAAAVTFLPAALAWRPRSLRPACK